MARIKNKSIKEFYPKSRTEWRSWLSENHNSSSGVWLILAKKESGIATVTLDEAVDEALCFGWIDSLPNKVDEKRYKILISPRKPSSNWSGINKERVAKLQKQGLMAEPGIKMVKLAKQSGTWDALNQVENLVNPPDLQQLLDEKPQAAKHYEAFPRSVKRGILEWILNARKPETRQKRIDETVNLAAQNIRANQYRQPKGTVPVTDRGRQVQDDENISG